MPLAPGPVDFRPRPGPTQCITCDWGDMSTIHFRLKHCCFGLPKLSVEMPRVASTHNGTELPSP